MTDPVAPAGPPARPRRVRWGLWHGLMLVVSALFLLPLASMIVGSLRQPGLPPPRGIEMSSTITSGASCSASATASSPLPASPTTSKPLATEST